jgi:type IV pilus assembly protein PilY1
MRTMGRLYFCAFLFLVLFAGLFNRPATAASMNNYCVLPPFIKMNVPANLLLLLDNSSSMYDLSYADEGNKDSSGTVTRQPYYCFDETYRSRVCSNNSLTSCSLDSDCGSGNTCIANTYAGYFASDGYYSYDFAATARKFSAVAGLPGTCTRATANLCLVIDAGNHVTGFTATGNYLNWLTASKFDVEKKILTGGKYDGAALIAESRGCLGQKFIKEGLTDDFVNFATGATDPNKANKLGITFAIRGPFDSANPSAPSRGGLSHIEIFSGTYNNELCQKAMAVWGDPTAQQTEVRDKIEACLNYNPRGANYCSGKPSISCTTDANCVETIAAAAGGCSDSSASCNADADCGSTTTPGRCSNDGSACTANADCGSTDVQGTCSNRAAQSCSTSADCSFSAAPGGCSNNATLACNADNECTYASSAGGCSNNGALICTADSTCGSTSVAGKCSNSATLSCTTDANCTIPATPGKCSNNASLSCSTNANCTYASSLGRCSNDNTVVCTADSTCGTTTTPGKCKHKTGSVYLSCSNDAACGSDGPCDNPAPTTVVNTCTNPSPVISTGTCTNPAPVAGSTGTCTNPAPSTVVNTCTNPKPVFSTGTCTNPAPSLPDIGTCDGAGTVQNTCVGLTTVVNTCSNPPATQASSISYAPCVNPDQMTQTKTKIAYSHVIQTCWSYFRNGNFSNGDYVRQTSKCDDVFTGWGICSVDNTRVCAIDTDCSASGLGTCQHGPNSIRPGNPAYVCSNEYLGQYCTWNGTSCAWSAEGADTNTVLANFCNGLQPTVIDQSDTAATIANYETVPAILSGIGVEAQLGSPIGTLEVKLGTSAPSGLLQEFNNQIRFGSLNFNFAGAATEASSLSSASIKQPRVCSNDHFRLCSMDDDCTAGGTCLTAVNSATYNLDGGQIPDGSYVGQGFCATMTTTPCSVDGDCGFGKSCLSGRCGTRTTTKCATDILCASGDTCMSSGVGSHTAGLVNVVDNIRANAWTPLSEAFYEAMGYYARLNDGKSRTDLRLNTADYLDTMNPSQYSCQKNYVLVVTDGSATADQNSSVATLAGTYASAAGVSAATCPNYNGSTYLPILTWLGQNRNIANFTAAPADGRDYITTFVVATGGDNGLSGDCNSLTYLAAAASKGGTTLNRANNPAELEAALRDVFKKVAAQSSSGTAASILSNSEGSGANILQAVFYPEKSYDDGVTKVSWAGEMQNLWYFIDPFIGRSSVREDTDYPGSGAHYLNLKTDNVAQFKFNDLKKETEVILSVDSDADGAGDLVQPSGFPKTVTPDAVKSLWRAGRLLWDRDLSSSPRTIYTQTAGSRVSFTALDTADTTVQGLLQASDQAEANNIISYTKGIDLTGYRSRTIATSTTSGAPRKVWRLGDIVSSTPRVQSSVRLNGYHLEPTTGYNDFSYGNEKNKTGFIYSSGYQSRGMAYVGANDGMLHAFKLGVLDVTPADDKKATLTGTDLGKEEWAFIPKNALPYLKYLGDPNYPHLYYIDGSTVLSDVSIGCADNDYWDCAKTPSTWRTVLLAGMGLGGASRNVSDSCTEGTGGTCVKTPLDGVGYSSYFALDVTNQSDPQFLWEFSDATLGYATTGPAIVRLSATTTVTLPDSTTATVPDKNKNGHWYAVFASGPTGPIHSDTCQFRGYSDQKLRLFIVDLKTGTLLRTIVTDIDYAFAGSISSGTIDADRWEKNSKGFYQDDAVYVGYVKKAGDGTWTDGGVLRLVTKESTDVNDWAYSKVIDGIGPVTSSIVKLQDRKKHNLWLYYGTGRYFYNQDDKATSDPPRRLFGIKEPCYKETFTFNGTPYRDKLDPACTDTLGSVAANLTDKTSDNSDSLSLLGNKGWFIDLEGENVPVNGYGAERIISDPVAMVNGVVFFTSFKPTADPCKFGGQSYMWATKYDTGGTATAAALQGKALVQVSTGSFEELDLDQVFTDKGGRRQGTAMTGKPPSDPPPIVTKSNLKPVKKVLHIKER